MPIRRVGDPFDWLMERIDRLPPEQAEAARALMTAPGNNLDDVVYTGRSIIDEMRAFMPSDLIDEVQCRVYARCLARRLQRRLPAPTDYGDRFPFRRVTSFLPVSGSVGFEGILISRRPKGYTGAPRA